MSGSGFGVRQTGASPGASAALAVAHVLAPASYGGLERVVISLADGQSRRGYRVCVVAIVSPGEEEDHPFVDQARAAGLKVAVLPVPGRGYLRERRAVRELCCRLSVQVLHTHGYRPDVVDSGVAPSLGIPRVTTVHGFCGGGWRNRLYERLQTLVYRRFDAVVAVSGPLADDLARAGVPAQLLHVVTNGWAIGREALSREAARRELGLAPPPFHLGWVGRVSREKGLDVMVEALPLLRDLQITLSVIGDGPDREKIEMRARALGVADRIRWHGVVPEAARLFPAFDAFILSSRTEGTPIALFEAMEAGLPIVATRVGGVPDVVSPAEAILTPTEDPSSLAAAIHTLVRDPAAGAERARAAQARLRSAFAPDTWLDRYDALYRQLQSS
jgi:glycosyltransferase involved in cell wall biosynthesis